MSALPRLTRRRAAAALAAAGLPVAALAAGPPTLPAPDAPAASSPDAPLLPVPTRLETAFEQARPLPAPTRDWTDIPGFDDAAEDGRTADRKAAGTDADDRPAATRGWLSFRPARVRTVSGLNPAPDPQFGGGNVYDGAYGGPAPAPRPVDPPARFDDYPAPAFPAPDASFTPAPRSSNYAPPADFAPPAGAVLPPAPYAPPVRDLRTPEPPPFAPYPAVPPAPYALEPVGGVPFGAGFPPPHAGGIGAGFGAGPVADLASAGGLCDLDGCGLPLFGAVRIEDRRNIAPHGVRKVVAVSDPRLPGPPRGLARLFHRVRGGDEPGCVECDAGDALVFVEVCVPDCRPEEVKVTRRGRRVHLDYGEYEVTLTARDGYVHVDYDD